MTVSSHPELAWYIKTLEFSNTGDVTRNVFATSARDLGDISGWTLGVYLESGEMSTAPPAITALELNGCNHAYGRWRLAGGVLILANIRMLVFDMTWLSGKSVYTREMIGSFEKAWEPPQWMSELTGLRDLSLTQQPRRFSAGNGREGAVFMDSIRPFLEAGVSGLEKLSLHHNAARILDIKNFLRDQPTTLVSLRISEPLVHMDEFLGLKHEMPQLVPNLQDLYCKGPSVRNDEELNNARWSCPRKTGNLLLIRYETVADH